MSTAITCIISGAVIGLAALMTGEASANAAPSAARQDMTLSCPSLEPNCAEIDLVPVVTATVPKGYAIPKKPRGY